MRGSGSQRIELAKVEALGMAKQLEYRRYGHKIYRKDKLARLPEKEKKVLKYDLLFLGAIIIGFFIVFFVILC
ncbi:MAG TPA: hypothetical protein ENN25_07605 [Euryarchaeota archaeon]|nr:hypothetical protein [Euryarchaeota archaeon]